MTKEEHRTLGITYFNATWDFIDKADKTEDDILQMLDYAHASKFHWQQSEPPILNIVRSEWLLGRVYCEAGLFDSAYLHASRCADLTIQNNIYDFDLVFAYEGLARAYLIPKDRHNVEKYLKLAYQANENVKAQGDRDYCKSQLDDIQSKI